MERVQFQKEIQNTHLHFSNLKPQAIRKTASLVITDDTVWHLFSARSQCHTVPLGTHSSWLMGTSQKHMSEGPMSTGEAKEGN